MKRIYLGLLFLVLALMMPVGSTAFCPPDPDVMCGFKCDSLWCEDGGEAGKACIHVDDGNTHQGCLGNFSHCSCELPPGL
jgi:hypothetical protein